MSDDKSLKEPAPRVLRADSDRLLKAVDELRALEREKRLQDVSTEPFQELALRVEEKARQVFRLAEQEDEDGSWADPHGSIEDSDPEVDSPRGAL
jgi:hypothetical protein